LKKYIIAFVVFVALFLLSLDFWAWGQSEPLFLGLPFWVYYLFFLTIATSIAFFIFSKYNWSGN